MATVNTMSLEAPFTEPECFDPFAVQGRVRICRLKLGVEW